jgi:hypothetical protein
MVTSIHDVQSTLMEAAPLPEFAPDEVHREIFRRLNVVANRPTYTPIYTCSKSHFKTWDVTTSGRIRYLRVPVDASHWEAFTDITGQLAHKMTPKQRERFGVDKDGNILPGEFADTVRRQMNAEGWFREVIEVDLGRKKRRKRNWFKCAKPGCPYKTGIPKDDPDPPETRHCGLDMVPGPPRRMLDDNGLSAPERGCSIVVVTKPDTTPYAALVATLADLAETQGGRLLGTQKELVDECGGRFSKAEISAFLKRYGFKRQDQTSRVSGKTPTRRYHLTVEALRQIQAADYPM